MIKPDDIKKHTAEFFTSDPDFVLWCLDPERAQDGYWCGYTERHPQDLVEFERAVSLVRRVGKTHPALPSVEKQLLLDRILTDHYARRRFAAPPRRRNRTALFAAASLLVAGVVAALFWSADFTGSGLPSAEAYENITLVTREGSREVYDDIARYQPYAQGRNPDRRQGERRGGDRSQDAPAGGARAYERTGGPQGQARTSATLRRDAGVDQFGVGAPFPVGVR